MMKKRVLALTLAMCMGTSLLAGCGGGKEAVSYTHLDVYKRQEGKGGLTRVYAGEGLSGSDRAIVGRGRWRLAGRHLRKETLRHIGYLFLTPVGIGFVVVLFF